MYKVIVGILLVLGIFSITNCKQVEKMPNSYILNRPSGDEEEYYHYLGEAEISGNKYTVLNFFKKIKAAQLWHGQSRLVFMLNSANISYALDSDADFPTKIVNNKLFFSTKNVYYKIDSLSSLLCIPTGCFQKEDSISSLNYFKLDSINMLFKRL